MTDQGYTYNLGLRFAEIVNRAPEHVALKTIEGQSLTYAELDQLSDCIAGNLLEMGLGQGSICALFGRKAQETYGTMIACLKLGIPYVILDPESPGERLAKICKQVQASLVIGYEADRLLIIPGFEDRFCLYADLDQTCSTEGVHARIEAVTGENPAYIMYTSGSTGMPKGAVMTHKQVLNFVHWCRTTFSITPEDVHTNVNPLYFDNSVFDFYSSLFNGAQLVPITKKQAIQPRILLNILTDMQCTTWFSVPSMLIYLQTSKAIIPEKWQSVKKIIFGGEGYPKGKLIKLYEKVKHNTTIFNVYGPTECTCMCSSYTVSDDDFQDLSGFLPLGSMAENFSYLILDDDGKPVKSDEKGELYLGGPNVGLGYFKDPVRTQKVFQQNPFHSNYRDIFYRTGDVVSFQESDQKIYIHGRADFQIKHMGYRIELEEIESGLNQLDAVSESAVIAVGGSNDNKILGFVETNQKVDEKTLKFLLKNLLPYYMIPSKIYFVDRIPKNQNGKTNRMALKDLVDNG